MSATEVRTTLNLPAEMAKAVDNYWHGEQLRSRNEAIRELLAYALDRKACSERSVAVSDKPAKEPRR
jgi:metal-responsive CopG/Arc/MetJ family transcriptional regulator